MFPILGIERPVHCFLELDSCSFLFALTSIFNADRMACLAVVV